MLTNFNLSQFIKNHVTNRQQTLLQSDFKKYNTDLNNRINNKKVLVIGGAGTIGSFYIKAMLKFNVAKLPPSWANPATFSFQNSTRKKT